MAIPKAQKQSYLNKFKQKLKSYFKKPAVKATTLLMGVVLILGLIFTGINQVQRDTARAGLNCPAGSTINGTGDGCVSTTPSAYTCPGGQSLGGNGAQCFVNGQTGTSYSCPSGGSVSGASCVASGSSPVSASAVGCSPGVTNNSGAGICRFLYNTSNYAGVLEDLNIPCPTLEALSSCLIILI